MPVAVVQVGPMRVGVRQRRVAMPVAVLHLGGEPGMLVGVVSIVVAVGVHVFDVSVDVFVLVLGAHDRRDRRDQQRPADDDAARSEGSNQLAVVHRASLSDHG